MPSRSTTEDSPIDKDRLEKFLRRIPTLSAVIENHSQMAAHFGYYLSEELGDPDLTPRRIRACYDAASISPPANMADTMKKSHAFVHASTGTKLHREARTRIQSSLEGPRNGERANAASHGAGPLDKARNIVVIHGRDSRLRDSMFQLLRSIGLSPVEWNEAVRRTGRGTPYTGEVLDALFREAQAVVVIMSPDEHVELRADLKTENSNDNNGWQPRPNVFIEAGIALSRSESHTIFLQIGAVREASDLTGRHSVRFDGSPTTRHSLIERLRTAGCAVSTVGSDWLRVGDFDLAPTIFTELEGRKK
jgi:Predicted nucleotide-binding protein containing TIR-like domain